MKRIALLALLLLTASSCIRNEPVRPLPPSFVRITPVRGRYDSGLRDPARFAIRDVRTFADFWQRAFGSLEPIPPIPGVDFAHEMVVVVAMGEQPSGGFQIEITDAAEAGGRMEVEVRNSMPGDGCVRTMSMTRPIDLVKVPVTRSVEFHDRTVARSCGSRVEATLSPSRRRKA